MQKRCNSIASAMELHLFCIKADIYQLWILSQNIFGSMAEQITLQKIIPISLEDGK